MSLSWNIATVETPWANVTTVHWAVPEDDDDDNDKSKKATENLVSRMERELETSEDELGAVLWNSNSVAAKFLDKHFESSNTKKKNKIKMLELGAGVGCLGIGAAVAGMDVCITDIPRLVSLLNCNIEANKSKLAAAASNSGSVFAAGLAWQSPLPEEVEKWWNSKKGDCRRVIVMIDALYGEKKAWPALVELLRKLIGNDQSVEIINFCEQRVEGVEDGFLEMLDNDNKKNDDSSSLQWIHKTEELAERSAMDMMIRATVIRRALNKESGARRERE